MNSLFEYCSIQKRLANLWQWGGLRRKVRVKGIWMRSTAVKVIVGCINSVMSFNSRMASIYYFSSRVSWRCTHFVLTGDYCKTEGMRYLRYKVEYINVINLMDLKLKLIEKNSKSKIHISKLIKFDKLVRLHLWEISYRI